MSGFKIGDRVEVRPSNAYKYCPLLGTIAEIDRDASVVGGPCYIVRIDQQPLLRLRGYASTIKLIDAVTLLGEVVR